MEDGNNQHLLHQIPNLSLNGSANFQHLPLRPPSARTIKPGAPKKPSPKHKSPEAPNPTGPRSGSSNVALYSGLRRGHATSPQMDSAEPATPSHSPALNPHGSMLRVAPLRPPSERSPKRGEVPIGGVGKGDRRRPNTASLRNGAVGSPKEKLREKKKVPGPTPHHYV